MKRLILCLIVLTNALPAQNIITCDHDTLDYGTVTFGSNSQRAFKCVNTSSYTIIINRVQTGDPHWADHFPKIPLKPNESFIIGITYDTKRIGKFSKQAIVQFQAHSKDTILKDLTKQLLVKANILPEEKQEPCSGFENKLPYKIEIPDRYFSFPKKRCGDSSVTTTFKIVNTGCKESVIEDIWGYRSSNNDQLEYEVMNDYKKPIQPKDTLSVKVKFSCGKDAKKNGSLLLFFKLSHSSKKEDVFIYVKD